MGVLVDTTVCIGCLIVSGLAKKTIIFQLVS
jgi:hypothetical protein